jgi:tRNA(Ile)-lysidine synthase
VQPTPPESEKIIAQFLAAVRATARRYGMWEVGERLVVAVSGGPDSVALLDALVRLAPEEALHLVVAHFHHGLRGAEADADAECVRSLAAQYGLDFCLGRGDVAAEAQRMKRGLQAAARRLRLEFLARVAAERGCRRVALGHTASDRVETVLIHLLRGAGIWGLRGIPPVRGPFVRPLIEVWHAQVEAYCQAAGLKWRTDLSNLDAGRFLRSRIRQELLPLLEQRYRRGAARAILRSAEAVEVELQWTEPLVAQLLAEIAELRPGRARLPLARLRQLSEGLLVRLLRAAAQESLGPLWDWSWPHFAALLALVRRGQTGQGIALPGQCQAQLSYGWLVMERLEEAAPPLPLRPLPVPGEVELPEAGLVLRGHVCRREEAPSPGPLTAVLAAHLAQDLLVRGWQPGDRFAPLGMGGARKKLQDFFTDLKIPRQQRRRVPLVIHPRKGIIWVVGLRVAEDARPLPEDEQVLVLQAQPLTAERTEST